MNNKIYRKSATKISISSVSLSLFSAVIIIFTGTMYYYNSVISSLSEGASVAALEAANAVDRYKLAGVIAGECDEGWQEIQSLFDAILNANINLMYLYMMVEYEYEADRFKYIVSANHPELRGMAEEPGIYGPQAWRALRYGVTSVTNSPAVAGHWGIVIAAFAPVYGADGEIMAVLGADIDISVVHRQTIEFVTVLSAVCVLMSLCIGFFIRMLNLNILKDFAKKLIEAEQAREMSMRDSETKTRFLAKMSHEIRTPMNVVIGLTQLQLQKETHTEEARETFLQIFNSSKLLLNIINDILDYSKAEFGKMEPAPYHLRSLLVPCLQLGQVYLGEKPIKFELDIPDDIFSDLYGDRMRIQQVLNNLLSNAFKYTTSGSVALGVSYTDLKFMDSVLLEFSVKDTGVGMTAEDLGLLFKTDYVRFEHASTKGVEGTGLGMSIAHQLATQMGGLLHADSEYGKGSVFVFQVTQKKRSDERLGAAAAGMLRKLEFERGEMEDVATVAYVSMSDKSVLVVDDISSNLVVISEMLAMYGLKVETAASGIEALKRAESGMTYDLVFMDYMMPELDGLAAMQRMREMGYKKPIVVLTADVTNNNEELFIANGFDAFLSKPVDISQLDSCLKRFVPEAKDGGEIVKKPRSEKLLKSFLTDVGKETECMKKLLEPRVYDEAFFGAFKVSAHGLKSACANMGLAELSKIAAGMESAARESDAGAILASAPGFIKDILEEASRLGGAGGGAGGTAQAAVAQIDYKFFVENLELLAEDSEYFDAANAKRSLKLMEDKECDEETRRFIDEAKQLVFHAKFEELEQKARGLAGRLKQKLKGGA